jgi:hypothetical protein
MRRVYWLALTLVCFIPAVAYGDSEYAPYTYTELSPNGQYLFVMLAPGKELAGDVPYTVSGLYFNDTSTTPLWTVDWWAPAVDVLSDGVHLVRWGEPWAEDTSYEALTFFANGKMLRAYRINDLLDTTLGLHVTVSHFVWKKEYVDVPAFDVNNHTLTLVMGTDEKYIFDYTTGEIISARRPLRAFFTLLAAEVLFVGLLRFRKWRSAIHT